MDDESAPYRHEHSHSLKGCLERSHHQTHVRMHRKTPAEDELTELVEVDCQIRLPCVADDFGHVRDDHLQAAMCLDPEQQVRPSAQEVQQLVEVAAGGFTDCPSQVQAPQSQQPFQKFVVHHQSVFLSQRLADPPVTVAGVGVDNRFDSLPKSSMFLSQALFGSDAVVIRLLADSKKSAYRIHSHPTRVHESMRIVNQRPSGGA